MPSRQACPRDQKDAALIKEFQTVGRPFAPDARCHGHRPRFGTSREDSIHPKRQASVLTAIALTDCSRLATYTYLRLAHPTRNLMLKRILIHSMWTAANGEIKSSPHQA